MRLAPCPRRSTSCSTSPRPRRDRTRRLVSSRTAVLTFVPPQIWSHTEDDNVWHVKLPPPGDLPAVPEGTAPPPEVDGWTDTFGFSDNVPLATLIPVALSCRVESSGAPGGGVHVRIAAPAPADANVGGTEAGLPPLLLHWGFVPRGGRNDVWALPQQPSWPEGTKSVNGRALQSKLLPLADAPGFVGVDIELGSNASLIGFVLKEDSACHRVRIA